MSPPARELDESLPAFGPFVRTGNLGQGGSGAVYAVERDGAALALKVLRADLALSSRERQRFLDEAERMRRLEHRAIVPLVDAGTLEDGRPFIAMPLIVGETLAARLLRGRLDLATALLFFADIADALETIHQEGLIHRDVKPENVILSKSDDGSERPVLLDLGIARDATASASTTTEQGNVRGTRAYMAPERFFGVGASTATDIYELGVLLYMMLVGEPPWTDGDGAASRLHPRDPAELGVALPEALRTTLLRALSTRPEMRPASVAAFAESVRAAGEPAVAASAPPPSMYAATVQAADEPAVGASLPVVETSVPAVSKRHSRLVAGVVALGLAGAAAVGSTFAAKASPGMVVVSPTSSAASDVAPLPKDLPPTHLAEPAAMPATQPSAARAVVASRKRALPVAGAAAVVEPVAPVAQSASPAVEPPSVSSADRLYMDRK